MGNRPIWEKRNMKKLARKYLDKGMNAADIARLLGWSSAQVAKYVREVKKDANV